MAITSAQRAQAWTARVLDEFYREQARLAVGFNRSAELPQTGRTINVGQQNNTSLVGTYTPYTAVTSRRVATTNVTLALDQTKYVSDEYDLTDITNQPINVVGIQARNTGRAIATYRNSYYVDLLTNHDAAASYANLGYYRNLTYFKSDSSSSATAEKPKWGTKEARALLIQALLDLYHELWLRHWPVGGGIYCYVPAEVFKELRNYYILDNPAALPGQWREGAATSVTLPSMNGFTWVNAEEVDFTYNDAGAGTATARDATFDLVTRRYSDGDTAAATTWPIMIAPANDGFHYVERVWPQHEVDLIDYVGRRTILVVSYGAKVLQSNHLARLDFTLTA